MKHRKEPHEAIGVKNNMPEQIRKLIAAGILKKCDSTPLFIAAQAGRADTVQLLLEAGADVNRTDNYATPLIAAVLSGSEETIKLLLEAGADVDAQVESLRQRLETHKSLNSF